MKKIIVFIICFILIIIFPMGFTSALYLNDLIDVTIISPKNGHLLTYNGSISKWVNANPCWNYERVNFSYGSDYDYFKNITINKDLVTSTLTNFPILVHDNTGDLLNKVKSNCSDLDFWDKDNLTQLSHEIEFYNSTTGELFAWVKIPSLSNTINTYINMCYGNLSQTGDRGNNPSDVWSNNYIAVWHLNDLLDSTSNSWDLTNIGADLTVDGGKINSCYRFIESNVDYMIHTTFLDVMPVSDKLTMEVWANHESDTGSDQTYISKTNINAEDRINLRRSTSTDFLNVFAEGSNGGNDLATDGALNDDIWYYCVGIYNSGLALKVVRDGINIVNGDVIGDILDGSSQEFYIGAFSTDYGEPTPIRYTMDGYLDEIRISDSARSDSWIKTCFYSQNETSGFMNIGNEIINIKSYIISPVVLLNESYKRVGINDLHPDYALELPNWNNASGKIRANAYEIYSDARFKNYINLLPENKVLSLCRIIDWYYYNPIDNTQLIDGTIIMGEINYSKILVGTNAKKLYERIENAFSSFLASQLVYKPVNKNTDYWAVDYDKIFMIYAKAWQINDLRITILENEIIKIKGLIGL